MKRVLCTVFLACLPTAGSANPALVGRISLYSDAASTQCTLADNEPRLGEVFIVHNTNPYDAYLISFQLTASPGFAGSWVQDVVPAGMSAVGTSPNGIAIHYQACRKGDVSILRATYQLFGTSSQCSFVRASAYPGFGFIEASGCSFEMYEVAGGALVVNPNETCPCPEPVPVQTSTWGHVKALYR